MPGLRAPAARIAAALAALLAAAGARAQEFQPYPSPKVTIEQWQRYLATVREIHGRSMEIFKDQHLVAFNNPQTRTFYIFTTKDHPAHPAWITRQLVEEGGQVNVRQIGFFAGEQEPFDALFRDYLRRNEALRSDVERRNR